MYDTIKLELEPTFGYYTRADMERVQARLTAGDVRDSKYNSVGYLSGYLDNLRVTMTDKTLTVEGSISKFIKGNQFETITLTEVQEAVKQISESLGMPMEQAIIKRVDFAVNVITEYKPVTYYPFFGKTQGYRRQEKENGIVYEHTNREFVLYDKIREMKRTHEEIPTAYKGKNVLRLEFKLLKYIPNQLNMGKLTADLLYAPAFYQQIQTMFLQQYDGLNKHYEFATGTEGIRSTADTISYVVQCGIIHLGGMNKAIQLFDYLKQIGQLTPLQAYQARQQIKKHAVNEHISKVSPLIEELDRKVQELTSITPLEAAA